MKFIVRAKARAGSKRNSLNRAKNAELNIEIYKKDAKRKVQRSQNAKVNICSLSHSTTEPNSSASDDEIRADDR